MRPWILVEAEPFGADGQVGIRGIGYRGRQHLYGGVEQDRMEVILAGFASLRLRQADFT